MRSVAGTTAALAAAVTLIGLVPAVPAVAQEPYLAGRGLADITGEAAESGMMGYGDLDQSTTGIHQRQRSRAFVVVDRASGRRVVFVQADLGQLFSSVHKAVLERLRQQHGTLYTRDNVMLTANHTHSGPGGHSHYTLYNVTTFGFHDKTFRAIVDGITESVNRAHANLGPATLSLAHGTLTNASANRSRQAFERNPAADKAFFPDAIDPQTTVLRIDKGGRAVGAINWFATHNTSMTTNNTLISPDNKGYAAYRWEREIAGVDYRSPANPAFVAAFAQTNAGDMTPNLNLRPGSGPTEDEFENTRIIGTRQYDAARTLLDGPRQAVTGGVDSRFSVVDLSAVTVRPQFTGDGREHRTCDGALGASFAAGSTEDGGGGLPIFGEGPAGNPLFDALSEILYVASPELRQCQAPKDILLSTGSMGFTADVLPLQLMRIGQLVLVGVPQEATIVAGLRLRRTVAATLGVPLQNVLISGYANEYAGYLTTPEEYDNQDYEGGHTLFGRWSLPAYQQEFARIAGDLAAGRPTAPGPAQPDGGQTQAFQPGVVMDAPQFGRRFGDVLTQPAASYQAGQRVSVEFSTGHPKNDLRRGGTFLEVQRLEDGTWRTVADDGDRSTTYRWRRDGVAASIATITWDVPPGASGTYRIVHHGDARGLFGQITAFTGASRTFTVPG
ncbi:MAG TPA: neutral/alkaline ceramidase [Pseudonocardiaceae bacterium]